MNLIGVIHLPKYLETTCKCIDGIFPQNQPKSMLVELPSDFDNLPDNIKLDFEFMPEIARIYSAKGTEIFYGDSAFRCLEFVRAVGIVETLIVEQIKKLSPELIVVGRSHADMIKEEFPHCNYTAFTNGMSHYRDNGLANSVIRLD